MRAVEPARGGGDIRWLAQNYTGRTSHTATKQDQLKIGFRQGLDRVPGARLVSPKWFPRWWRDADRELRIGSGGWAVLCPFWRRARVRVRDAVADGGWGSAVPRFAGRVAASVFDGSGRMFRLSRGCDGGFWGDLAKFGALPLIRDLAPLRCGWPGASAPHTGHRSPA